MIAVTGGTGFIGAHLLLHLADRGYEIKALRRPSSDPFFYLSLFEFYGKRELISKIQWVEGELDEGMDLINFLEDCDTVYHVAGKVSFSEKDWTKLLATNRNATTNLVNAALSTGVERFCLFSSIAALDMSQGVKGKKTDWKHFRKEQPYGYSKYLGELEVRRGGEEGLKTLILNPAVVLGPSCKSNSISGLIDRLKRGLKYYPTGANGFVGVDELCALAIDATEGLEDQLQLTVCSDNLSFREILNTYAEEGGFRKPSSPMGPALIFGARFLNRLFNLLSIRSSLSSSGLRALSSVSTYDDKSYRRYLKAEQKSIKKAIADAIAFYTKIDSKPIS